MVFSRKYLLWLLFAITDKYVSGKFIIVIAINILQLCGDFYLRQIDMYPSDQVYKYVFLYLIITVNQIKKCAYILLFYYVFSQDCVEYFLWISIQIPSIKKSHYVCSYQNILFKKKKKKTSMAHVAELFLHIIPTCKFVYLCTNFVSHSNLS